MYRCFFLFLSILFGLIGCDDANNVRIPYAPVLIKINTIVERDKALSATGSGVSYTTSNRIYDIERMGFGGVYVFHTYSNNLAAFDLSCPVEASRSAKLVRYGNDKLKCNTCGSVYEIGWGVGNPIGGPANTGNYSLQRYRVRTVSSTEYEVVN